SALNCVASKVSVNYVLQGTTCPTCGIFDPTRLSAADQDTNSTGNVSLKDTLGSSAPGIDYSEDAEATAGYGNLHAFVDGTALANTGVNSEGNGNAIASALASWDDSVLVSVPSRSNNARITFHTSLMVHGTLGASASASPAELE